MELLDGEAINIDKDEVEIIEVDDHSSDDEEEEEEEEGGAVTSSDEIDLDISDGSETEMPAEEEIVHNTFAEDTGVPARIEDFLNAEKAKSSKTLLPFFVSVNNSIKQARLSVRKRAAVDAEVVKNLVKEAKKRKESGDNA